MEYTIPSTGKPGATTKVTGADTAATLSAIYNSTTDGKPAIGAIITCEVNNIRWTLGTATPTQGASGLGHVLVAGQSMVLQSGSQVRAFKHINYTNAANAILQITPLFEGGAS